LDSQNQCKTLKRYRGQDNNKANQICIAAATAEVIHASNLRAMQRATGKVVSVDLRNL
jgi:hypothetical protein